MTIQIMDLNYNDNPSSIEIHPATVTITDITSANPGVVTVAEDLTGVEDGTLVLIRNVVGMVEVNDTVFTISNVTQFTFELGVNTSPFGTYTSGGNALEIGEAGSDNQMSVIFDDSQPKDQIVLAAVNAWHRLAEGLT